MPHMSLKMLSVPCLPTSAWDEPAEESFQFDVGLADFTERAATKVERVERKEFSDRNF